MADDSLHQSQGVFGTGVLPNGIIPLQADVTIPQSALLATGTGMLVADRTIAEQLRHFPEEVYDKRPTSHLYRLMQVLLGDAGVGQLRKRLLLAQLQGLSATGARYFDLDRFYGSLFGASRTDAEQLPINPMETATATAAEWESIEAADASFRDRMGALARAVNQGGTLAGLKAAAEAVVGSEVEVFESWAMMEAAADPDQQGHDWDWLAGGTWGDYDGQIWGVLEGVPFYGRSGSLTRSEVMVRVHRDYAATPEGRSQRVSDEWALVRVLERLKPAHILLTVDTQGASALSPRAIATAASDSEFWELATVVTPQQTASAANPYPLSAGQVDAGITAGQARVLPRPPMTSRLGDEWSYGAQVPVSRSYAVDLGSEADFTEPGSIPDIQADALDQVIVWRDGTSTTYNASLAALDPLQAQAARAGADGVLVANTYSGDRRTVLTTD